MKLNINYYQHFSNSHEHPKFKMLRAKYGWEGEGKFWALNNLIAQADNCWLDLSKKYNKASIAVDLNFGLEEFDEYIKYMTEECNLLIQKNGKITTGIVQENLEKVLIDRKKARSRKSPKNNGSPELDESSPELDESFPDQNNKGKESKVKEKKVKGKESKPANFLSEIEKEDAREKIVFYLGKKYGNKRLMQMLEGADMTVPDLKEAVASAWVGRERTFNPELKRDQLGIESSLSAWIKNLKENPVTSEDRLTEKIKSVFQTYFSYCHRIVSQEKLRRCEPKIIAILKTGETIDEMDNNFSKISRLGEMWSDFEYAIFNYEKLKTYDTVTPISVARN